MVSIGFDSRRVCVLHMSKAFVRESKQSLKKKHHHISAAWLCLSVTDQENNWPHIGRTCAIVTINHRCVLCPNQSN